MRLQTVISQYYYCLPIAFKSELVCDAYILMLYLKNEFFNRIQRELPFEK